MVWRAVRRDYKVQLQIVACARWEIHRGEINRALGTVAVAAKTLVHAVETILARLRRALLDERLGKMSGALLDALHPLRAAGKVGALKSASARCAALEAALTPAIERTLQQQRGGSTQLKGRS